MKVKMEQRRIENVDFNTVQMDDEYSNCVFEYCDFSNLRISDLRFEDCEFKCCNFSLTKFCNVLCGVRFVECKMTGADFAEVSKFALSMRFEKCNMTYVSCIALTMKKTFFVDCDLSDAYFDSAILTASIFDRCNLSGASFFKTDLEKVDFSTSQNFRINPQTNRLKKTIFSHADLSGLLAHLDITIV